MAAQKNILVLSGGGFKGAFQWGALEYLIEQQQIRFDRIAGVSVGALNGALVAMDKFAELKALWQQVQREGYSSIYTSELVVMERETVRPDFEAIIRKLLPRSLFRYGFQYVFNRPALIREVVANFNQIRSLADNRPLYTTLQRVVRRSDFKVPFQCGVVSLVDANYYTCRPEDFASDEEFCRAILASTAMPIVWEPVKELRWKGSSAQNATVIREVVDGGIRTVSPLGDVVHAIKDETDDVDDYVIYILNCNSWDLPADSSRDYHLTNIALRALDDIAINEIFNDDLKRYLEINELVTQVRNAQRDQRLPPDFRLTLGGKVLKCFRTVLVQPEPGEAGHTLDSSAATIERRRAAGFRRAEEAFKMTMPMA
ncbi:patatin-like phospholipase family protein [Telluribacter sp. SYSU D00476]|uniref:patatin-like phospholipase family protein n=1 Tax=Telluribacter sp. SYSU D00476 TaxID=2811430 RepID=UPI001FF3D642|nr:patatin-like phospholipase family protein [Telluribacter sp. SYSU D00476]